MLAETELAHEALRAIVAALRARPEADAATLMTDLPTDAVRGTLAALLLEERAVETLAASIEQFERRLERGRRLRHMREVSRSIAEGSATTETLPHDEFRTLTREGKLVLDAARGIEPAQHTGSQDPTRSTDE